MWPARLAAQRGYAVCVNYRKNRQAAERVVQAIASSGGQAIAVAADVSVEADVARVAAAIVWLLSDEAWYVTGTFIDVTGGK